MRFLPALIILLHTSFALFSQKHDTTIINEIFFEGNAKTHEETLLRELTFKTGDTITNLNAKINQSKKNLLNTRLFHYAKVEVIRHKHFANILIKVQERWYLWPIPVFEYADYNLASWVRRKEIEYLNYGLILEERNFRGRNEKLKLKFRMGIREQYGINYSFPRIFNHPDIGGYVDVSYFRQKEIHQSIINQQYADFERDHYIFHEGRTIAGIRWRPGFYYNHLFYTGYRHYKYHKSIGTLFNKPLTPELKYLAVGYTFNFFKGDYIVYPLKGNKIKLTSEYGFGTSNYFYTDIAFSSHYPIHSRFTLSYGFNGFASFTNQYPHFLYAGPGKTWYIRGFEDYAYQKDLLLLNRIQMKYTALKKKSFHFKQIPSEKFNSPFLSIYINAFIEAGYGTSFNPEFSEVKPISIGTGVDFLTYYDWIGRFEIAHTNERKTWFNIHWGYIF